MSDQTNIHHLWSTSEDLSNDISHVWLSEKFLISTCLRSRVWEGLISRENVQSNWYSPSVISKSRAFQWYITCKIIWNFYILYIVKVRLAVLKIFTRQIPDFTISQIKVISPKSLNMRRLRNQRIFELQKSIIYRWKGLEKCCSRMIFSKTSTESLPSKNPTNPKNNPKTWYVKEKTFIINNLLYIVEKVFKSSIQWSNFQDRWLKPYHWKTPKTLKNTLKLAMSMKVS